ncbi:hypothetical protein J2T12_000983 [Paenibacillus anaericanus]|nr:hypothetical protein [Paenibacillus anaericanus]
MSLLPQRIKGEVVLEKKEQRSKLQSLFESHKEAFQMSQVTMYGIRFKIECNFKQSKNTLILTLIRWLL